MHILYCDGAARGNPGPAGKELHSRVREAAKRFDEVRRNMMAVLTKHQALILGMRLARLHTKRMAVRRLHGQACVHTLHPRGNTPQTKQGGSLSINP